MTNNELRLNPPTLKVEGKPREIKIDTVASMCDNKHRFTIKLNEEGDYKIYRHGYAWSCFGIKMRQDDVEWLADDGEWNKVFEAFNSGYQLIESVKYR
tara:strand:+ start:42 stop:335 length:294 start_codon:yes stop_codon:yes gene_type:complete